MNLLTVDSLTSFQNNPLIDQVQNRIKQVLILYGNDKEDRTHVQKIKSLLQYLNFKFKLEKKLAISQIYDSTIFHRKGGYYATPVVLIFPSIYKSEEATTHNLLDQIVRRGLMNDINIVPVVFNNLNFLREGSLSTYKTLDLSDKFDEWWGKFERILGRRVGHVHSLVVEDVTDDRFESLQDIMFEFREYLSNADETEQNQALDMMREHFDLETMIQQQSNSHSPTDLKKFPTAPDIRMPFENKTCNEKRLTTGKALRMYDTTSFTKTAFNHHPSKFLPLDKEAHVYIIHSNTDTRVVSKVKQMKCLLTIHGYRCMTMDDIPPGENIIKMAVQSHTRSYSTIVIDFGALDPISSLSAQHAYLDKLEKGIKFIPVVFQDMDSTAGTKNWKNNVTDLLITVDVSDNSENWFPKLERVLNNSQKAAGGDGFRKLQIMILNFKSKTLSQEHERHFLSKVLEYEDFQRFFAQANELSITTKRSRSELIRRRQNHRYEMADSSSSLSSMETRSLINMRLDEERRKYADNNTDLYSARDNIVTETNIAARIMNSFRSAFSNCPCIYKDTRLQRHSAFTFGRFSGTLVHKEPGMDLILLLVVTIFAIYICAMEEDSFGLRQVVGRIFLEAALLHEVCRFFHIPLDAATIVGRIFLEAALLHEVCRFFHIPLDAATSLLLSICFTTIHPPGFRSDVIGICLNAALVQNILGLLHCKSCMKKVPYKDFVLFAVMIFVLPASWIYSVKLAFRFGHRELSEDTLSLLFVWSVVIGQTLFIVLSIIDVASMYLGRRKFRAIQLQMRKRNVFKTTRWRKLRRKRRYSKISDTKQSFRKQNDGALLGQIQE